ncbi:putative membrane-associated kinase regulator 6 [Artemisia annua]|uniref:Putative membrane-associated kinase regulator 6 n=1 Tax=Artemisia annua TaxID=35608 RepID=A0A2U1PQA1_ARTAN|nr:putative membrane-associated kinase regulator 6 [Artemisia annua]
MEISPTLATESFSLSWLANNTSSVEEETKRFLEDLSSDFSFGMLGSNSPTSADEMFCDGSIVPKHFIVSKSAPATPSIKSICPYNTQNIHPRNIFREWKKSSKQVMEKLLRFLRPRRRSIRVDDHVNLTRHTPKIMYSYESDNSIYEAVLHCKRSNGI